MAIKINFNKQTGRWQLNRLLKVKSRNLIGNNHKQNYIIRYFYLDLVSLNNHLIFGTPDIKTPFVLRTFLSYVWWFIIFGKRC